jgi:hypothetical protein
MILAETISNIYDRGMFTEKLGGQVRDAAEQVTGQVRTAVERFTHSMSGIFAIALAAIAIASGALYVAIRALQATRPAAAA